MSIKLHKNWLVWKEKSQPVSALTGKSAGWNRNLATFAEAEQFCLSNPGYQIGLCFSEDLPYIGLDLDACIGEDGLEDWARNILHSFFEDRVISNDSVSGTGIKVVLKCSEKVKRGVKFIEAQQHGDHAPQVELFAPSEGRGGKYFALTSPLHINDGAGEVDIRTLSEIMGYDVSEVAKPSKAPSTSGDTTPEQLREVLSKLDVHNYDTRESWIKMLAASHHGTGGSEEGKEVFREWSMGDEANYSESDLQRDWASQNLEAANPITMGTMISQLPKEDWPERTPQQDFDIIEAPASTSRLLGWLLNDVTRNHSKVVEQLAVDTEGKSIKFVPEWNEWIVFNGTKWVRDSKGAYIHQVVKDYITSLGERIPDMGDPEQGAKAAGWICSQLNFNQTNGIIRQARGERGFMVQLDEMPSTTHLLNFKNGTYDLEKDQFRGHEREDYIFHTCDTNYVEGQSAELWERVIDDIFAGDADLTSFLQRLLGYALNGDTSDPMFNIFYGSGANGKSTIVNTVAGLLGEYAKNLPSELFDKNKDLHPTYLATLRGARLAVVAECESDVHLAEATIKKVTSQDKIEARLMRQDPWTFTPSHTSVLCTNHLPTVKGSDRGIWRRLKCVPFEVDLSDRKDATIPARLVEEYAGIANWLLQGHRDYVANGIGTCAAVEKATASYREQEDEFRRTFEDIFTLAEDSSISVTDALQVYTASGGRLGRKKFVAEMTRMGYHQKRIRVNGAQPYGFEGLRITMHEFGG